MTYPARACHSSTNRAEYQRDAASEACGGHQVPPGNKPAIFANDGNLPESVLKILTEHIAQVDPGPIPGNNTGRLPDLASCGNNPEIQFVILIAIQTLIEQTDAV